MNAAILSLVTISLVSLMIVVDIIHCYPKSHDTSANECKKVELIRIGCFNVDPDRTTRPLPVLLFTDLDTTSSMYSGIPLNLEDTDKHMISLICRCAFHALYMGYTTIGFQHYGECWSGKNSEIDYARDGPSRHCITWGKSRCRDSVDCIGEDGTNFVYKVYRAGGLPTAKPTDRVPVLPGSPNSAFPPLNLPLLISSTTPSGMASSTLRTTGSPTSALQSLTTTGSPTSVLQSLTTTGSPKSFLQSLTTTGSPTSALLTRMRKTKPTTVPISVFRQGVSFPSPTPSGSASSTAKRLKIPTKAASRWYFATSSAYLKLCQRLYQCIPPCPTYAPSLHVGYPVVYNYPSVNSICPQLLCPIQCAPRCSCTCDCYRTILSKKTKSKSKLKNAKAESDKSSGKSLLDSENVH